MGHYASEMEEQQTERDSALNSATARCDKAAIMIQEAWDILRDRIDPIVRPGEPSIDSNEGNKEMAALKVSESSHVSNLNGYAARLESIAAYIRNVTDRLDV